MKDSEVSMSVQLELPREVRVELLVSEYGVFPPGQLAACVRGLSKRLGDARTNELVAMLEAEPPSLAQVADTLLLHYYDGMYTHQASTSEIERNGEEKRHSSASCERSCSPDPICSPSQMKKRGGQVELLHSSTADPEVNAQLVLQRVAELSWAEPADQVSEVY